MQNETLSHFVLLSNQIIKKVELTMVTNELYIYISQFFMQLK